jgi:hypothetical protein
MASEQVRQASKVLGPLLRRRGTSPAVGATLRKALAALDKSMSGLDAQKQEDVIQAGIAELRACVALIRASDKPADHEQLPGIEKVLDLLAPGQPAGPAQSADLAPLSLSHEAAPVAASSSGESIRQTRAPKPLSASVLDFQTLQAQLAGLTARLELFHAVLGEPLFRLRDADAADEQLQKQVLAMRWLGERRVGDILRAVDAAATVEARLVAGAALVYLGAERGFEWLSLILEKAVGAGRTLPGLAHTILRTVAHHGLLGGVLKVFERPAGPVVSGAVLPLLAEYGVLSTQRLWELANHASDDVAIPAAHALAWTEPSHDTPMLLAWAGQARTARRAHALLFAAAGLGSAQALTEIRARLSAGSACDLQLVEALAVAGDASDAASILSQIPRAKADVGEVVLAAAHLGSTEALAQLASLADELPEDVLREARRMVVGPEPPDAGARSVSSPGRMLRGQPWSVAGVLDRLAALDEPLREQRRLALELRVRTGMTLPVPFPMLASAPARIALASQMGSHFAKAHSRLKPGLWHYQGRPLALSGAVAP